MDLIEKNALLAHYRQTFGVRPEDIATPALAAAADKKLRMHAKSVTLQWNAEQTPAGLLVFRLKMAAIYEGFIALAERYPNNRKFNRGLPEAREALRLSIQKDEGDYPAHWKMP